MKTSLRKKAVKYIAPVVAVGLLNIPDWNYDIGEKQTNNSFHTPEHPREVLPHNDNDELNRDRRTAAATGMDKAYIFFESYSNEYFI